MKNNIIILLFFKYFFIWSMMLHYSISKLLGDYYLHLNKIVFNEADLSCYLAGPASASDPDLRLSS